MKRPAFALIVTLLCAAAFAQDGGFAPEPTAAEQKVAPQKVKLGEPFTRTLTLTHPSDQRYELRVPTDWGEFELLSQERHRDDHGATATTTFTLQLSAFELGKRTLPALTFDVAAPQGTGQWQSATAEIEVESSLPKDADKTGANPYDIRPPEVVPVRSWALLWALAIALLTAVLAYLLYRWWKRPRAAQTKPAGPPLPIEVRARNALEELRRENLPAQGRIKEFYFRLTEIVRGYVGERYGVEALECTSSELVDKLRTVPAPGFPRDPFSTFLFDADLVKFAKAEMTPDDCARALDFSYQLIDQTTPRAPPPNAPERKLP